MTTGTTYLVADVAKMSFACHLSQMAICDIFDTYITSANYDRKTVRGVH